LGQLLLQVELLLKVEQQMLWQVVLLQVQLLLQVLLLHAQAVGAGICAANLAERQIQHTTNPPTCPCPRVADPLCPVPSVPCRLPPGAWRVAKAKNAENAPVRRLSLSPQAPHTQYPLSAERGGQRAEAQAQEQAVRGTRSGGKMPVGGWTPDQQGQWDTEEQARNTRAAAMQKRVERAEEELKRNPEKVSKKIVGAIQSMGVKPDRDHMDSLAAKVITYRRLRTRKEGNELLTDKAMARAVREKVEEHEASK
jgi:hypothetical protein